MANQLQRSFSSFLLSLLLAGTVCLATSIKYYLTLNHYFTSSVKELSFENNTFEVGDILDTKGEEDDRKHYYGNNALPANFFALSFLKHYLKHHPLQIQLFKHHIVYPLYIRFCSLKLHF